MADDRLQALKGRHVLVVEDEYLLAEDLATSLSDLGAVVLGPVGSVEDGLALLASMQAIDAAVLDLNLRGEMVFPVADALQARGIPFVFATGYDEWAVPERFADTPHLEKPVESIAIAVKVSSLLARTSA